MFDLVQMPLWLSWVANWPFAWWVALLLPAVYWNTFVNSWRLVLDIRRDRREREKYQDLTGVEKMFLAKQGR